MKKILLGFLELCLLSSISIGQKTIKTYYDPYTQKKIKEQYTVNSKGLQDGNYKQWNKDGILLMDYNFSNGQKNGKCVDYYSFGEYGGGIHCSGQPLVIEYFTNGEPTGIHTSYTCKNGNKTILKSKTVYSGNKYTMTYYYENGKEMTYTEGIKRNKQYWQEGKYKEFYENGKLKVDGFYKDMGGQYQAVKFGNWKYYNESGNIIGERNYNKVGKLDGKFFVYFENGKIKNEGEYFYDIENWGWYKESQKRGNWVSYDETGKKISEISYNDKGEANGTFVDFYDNGQQSTTGEYINGLKTGVWTEWFDNGIKKFEGTYKEDKLNGVVNKWNKNSSKLFEGQYLKGSKNGLCLEYDTSGNFIGQYGYVSGLKCWYFKQNGEFDYLITYDNDGQQILRETKEELQKKGLPILSALFAIRYSDFKTMTTKKITEKGGSTMYPTYTTKIEYPYGKNFYLKCNILLEDYSKRYLMETDTCKKSIILKEYNLTLDKLLSYKIQDAELIDKQLKKAKTIDEIKNILKL